MEILLDDLNVRALVGRISGLGWVHPTHFDMLWDNLMSIITFAIPDVEVRFRRRWELVLDIKNDFKEKVNIWFFLFSMIC